MEPGGIVKCEECNGTGLERQRIINMNDMRMVTSYNPSLRRYETIVSKDSPFEIMISLNPRYYIDSDGMEFSNSTHYNVVSHYKLSQEEVEKYNTLYEESKVV